MTEYQLSDISTQFREFQSPVVLNYLAALGGHAAPSLEGPFRFLVCGERTARSAATLAAAFPQGEFHIIETDPAFRERIRALVIEVGMTNVILHDVDLDDPEAPPLELPELDYVSVHGLYAQVGPVGQESLHQILRGRLRPGGLAFLSYCAFPGWASLTPLRALLREAARKSHAEEGEVSGPLELAERLRREGAQYFRDVPMAATVLDLYASLPAQALLREFLSPKQEPVGFDVVSARLEECGLGFVGSHPVHLNYVDMAVPAPLRAACHAVRDRRERERLMDFILNTKVREDIYVKRGDEQPTPTAERRQEALTKVVMGTPLPPSDIEWVRQFEHASLRYVGPIFERLMRAVVTGAHRLHDVAERPELAPFGPEAVVEAAVLLMAGGQFHPMALPAARQERAELEFQLPSAFNREVLRRSLLPASEEARAEFPSEEILVASPVAGNGILIPYDEAMILLAVSEAGAEGAVGWAWEALGAKDSDTDPRSFELVFRHAMESFRASRLYKYFELGIVSAPAQRSQTESPKS